MAKCGTGIEAAETPGSVGPSSGGLIALVVWPDVGVGAAGSRVSGKPSPCDEAAGLLPGTALQPARCGYGLAGSGLVGSHLGADRRKAAIFAVAWGMGGGRRRIRRRKRR